MESAYVPGRNAIQLIAHTQTIMGNGSEGSAPGNCLQAALASLLDLPLELVPHIILTHDWYRALKLFLDGRGKRLRIYTDREDVREYWQFIGVESYPLNKAPTDQMMLASGQSHNGPWLHMVVWKAGKVAHDPHPNRKGLASAPSEFWQITDATGVAA